MGGKYRIAAIMLIGLIALSLPGASPGAGKNPDLFAAIAYSPTTGKYGYAKRQNTRAAAEKLALRNCGAADATIVVWVRDGWCALAASRSITPIYGFGSAVKKADAERLALQPLANIRDAVLVVSVFSEK
jgi:hypothetical protein